MDKVLQRVFSDARFIGGQPVEEFEKNFSILHNMPHCISTGNGTDSLFLILKALNLPAGAGVIVPAWGCIASAEPVSLNGLKPVFCDVHPDYYTLDPAKVVEKISPETKAIIAVHLYGQPAPVQQLKQLCEQHQLYLIEDCAQGHLTKVNGTVAGKSGVASAFSFYPTKNLGAYGDAGCVLTADDDLAERIRRLANHGALKKDDHLMEGTNSRMDTLQAAVLNVKLRYLYKWNERRKEIALQYNQLLSGIEGLILPQPAPGAEHTFHIYCIRSEARNALRKYLADNGIETAVHYPAGLPFTQAYRFLHLTPTDFPVTANLQQQVLSLPIYPDLTPEEVTYIAKTIRNFFTVSGR